MWRAFASILCIASTACAETLALVNGTIYAAPEDEPVRKGAVLIEGGRIAAAGRVRVPRGARVIDCSGLTILAGFWNSHVHFFERKWENAEKIPADELERQIEGMTTRYGFTSVFDIGSSGANTRQIRDRIERGEVRGPRIRTTGEALVAPGAVPEANVLRMLGNMVSTNHEVTDSWQASAAAKTLLDAGADGLKVHLQRPIPEDAIRTAVEAAHRAGKPVFVHPSTRADVEMAARLGVDVLAHTTPFSPWDGSVAPMLAKKRVAVMPTLTVWRSVLRHGRLSAQEAAVRETVAQVKDLVAAGVPILFGNDLGAVEYDPREEYGLMAEAGMSFRQILASLTTTPAEKFGEATRRGRVASGLAADLAVVEGDPAKNVEALASVRYTLRDGKILFQAR